MGTVKEDKKNKKLIVDYANLTEEDKVFIEIKIKEGYTTEKKRKVSTTSKLDKEAFVSKLKSKKLSEEAAAFEATCNDRENGGFFVAKKNLRLSNPKAYYEILGKKGAELKKMVAAVEEELEAKKK